MLNGEVISQALDFIIKLLAVIGGGGRLWDELSERLKKKPKFNLQLKYECSVGAHKAHILKIALKNVGKVDAHNVKCIVSELDKVSGKVLPAIPIIFDGEYLPVGASKTDTLSGKAAPFEDGKDYTLHFSVTCAELKKPVKITKNISTE